MRTVMNDLAEGHYDHVWQCCISVNKIKELQNYEEGRFFRD